MAGRGIPFPDKQHSGAPVPWLSWPANHSSQHAALLPGRWGPETPLGSREDSTAVEQGGGRCQLTPLPWVPQEMICTPQITSSRSKQLPTSSPGSVGKENHDSPALPREEPSPSSQQEAQGATSQTTGVTAAPHRVMKDLGQGGWAGERASLSHRKQLQFSPSLCLSTGLWLKGKR